MIMVILGLLRYINNSYLRLAHRRELRRNAKRNYKLETTDKRGGGVQSKEISKEE